MTKNESPNPPPSTGTASRPRRGRRRSTTTTTPIVSNTIMSSPLLLAMLLTRLLLATTHHRRDCRHHAALAFMSYSSLRRCGLPPAAGRTSTSSSATSLPCHARDGGGVLVSTDESPSRILGRVDRMIDARSSYIDDGGGGGNGVDGINIMRLVDADHVRDVSWAMASYLPFEGGDHASSPPRPHDDGRNAVEYETIPAVGPGGGVAHATRTKRCSPLLTEEEIECLRGASESYWSRMDDGDDGEMENSRFTYQRKGNTEAHLSDVVRHSQRTTGSKDNCDVASLVDDMLLNRIYPWIRSAYLSREEMGNELGLFVYDSLFIRYNATAANSNGDPGDGSGENSGIVGAGQPLHRDLGYVSVNIMLNEEFEGGGTFFEDQLLPMVRSGNIDDISRVSPLKPLGPGHGIAHYSASRHAGAATYSGVREILVIFLAATERREIFIDTDGISAPRWERNARLKAAARTYCTISTEEDRIICRVLHHRLAIDQVMDDGEAWHYLGMALLDYHDHLQLSDDNIASYGSSDMSNVKLAVSCLSEATKHTPCDGRLYNNFGIALERMMPCYKSNSRVMVELRKRAVAAYQTSIAIHSKCEMMGCDVRAEILSASMNYGLYLSKLDQFGLAADILSRVVSHTNIPIDAEHDMDEVTSARLRVVADATKLLAFCKRQLDKESVV